jgi:predicted dehydrogenase
LAGIRAYFHNVAGFPPPTLWLWGAKPSILASLGAWTFFLARCISPLQHIKNYARVRFERSRARQSPRGRTGAIEIEQERPNFEARDTEIYFLTVLAIALVSYWIHLILAGSAWPGPLPQPGPMVAVIVSALRGAIQIWAAITAIEVFFWISYYLLWRNFAEPAYTLYHPVEYFVLFPFILLIQCLDIAILRDVGVMTVIVDLVGGATDHSAGIGILGQYYFVIIVTNLLSMFPATRFKTPIVINIIGAGEVVAERIVPAFLRDGGRIGAEHLLVHSLDEDDGFAPKLAAAGVALDLHKEAPELAESKIIKRVLASGAPAIIASPSDSHFRYITAFNNGGIRFAVEKPISTLPQEIKVFLDRSDIFRNNMFALSYYGLEKGLPLTYLLGNNHHYEHFLGLKADAPVADRTPTLHFDAPELLHRLGRLRSVRIDLVEGPDRSPRAGRRVWTEERGAQGLAFETMIHPLIMLHKLLVQQGLAIEAFVPEVVEGISGDAATPGTTTFLRYDAAIERAPAEPIAITLTCGKYADPESQARGGSADYANGRMTFDFDAKTCTVALSEGGGGTIFVRKEYADNYVVQTELMARFFATGWTDIRYDDLDDQLRVLGWLTNADLRVSRDFTYGEHIGYAALAEALAAAPPPPHPVSRDRLIGAVRRLMHRLGMRG